MVLRLKYVEQGLPNGLIEARRIPFNYITCISRNSIWQVWQGVRGLAHASNISSMSAKLVYQPAAPIQGGWTIYLPE